MRKILIIGALILVSSSDYALAQRKGQAPPPARAPSRPVPVSEGFRGDLRGIVVGVAVDAVASQAKEQYRCRNNVTYPQGTRGTVANSTPAVMICNNR